MRKKLTIHELRRAQASILNSPQELQNFFMIEQHSYPSWMTSDKVI